MTEAEWLACADPTPMLDFLRGKTSERKLRLFAVACCRRIWHLLSDERSKQVVEIAEGFAEGAVTVEELSEALGLAWRAYHDIERAWIDSLHTAAEGMFQARMMAAAAVGCVAQDEDPSVPHSDRLSRIELVFPVVVATAEYARRAACHETGQVSASEKAAQAKHLRDIIGLRFFHPVEVDPGWFTGSVVALAQSIYEERTFEQLPILADALKEAGCHDAGILSHCRGTGPHVRGCWLLDSLLGKE